MFRHVEFEPMIDLNGLEAGEIEVEADFNQSLKFPTERVILPTGILLQPVKRESKPSDLGLGASSDDHDPDVASAQAFRAARIEWPSTTS